MHLYVEDLSVEVKVTLAFTEVNKGDSSAGSWRKGRLWLAEP